MRHGNDPTRDEMLTALKQFDPAAEQFDLEAAIYWLASDYHGGQWSNLYAALCASPFRPSPLHREVADEGDGAEYLYRHLRDDVLK
jgi:hypothetical protein